MTTSNIVLVLLCVVSYLAIVKFLWCDMDPGLCGACGFFSKCDDDSTYCSGLLPLIPGYMQPFSKCLSVKSDDEETGQDESTIDAGDTIIDDSERMKLYLTFSEQLSPSSEMYKTFMSELTLWAHYKSDVHSDALDRILDGFETKEEPISLRHMIV